ncbi:MAG: hypothetical protein WC300_05050 [Candidatus Omnitrophota bacterium]
MRLICAVCLTEFDGAKEGEECPIRCLDQTKEKNEKGGGDKKIYNDTGIIGVCGCKSGF